MQKFILKILWFILPIIILAYPLDLFISHNLKKLNDSEAEYEIWNDIYEGNANCDIAIYGSSRAKGQINPKILEDSLQTAVYNFGIVAQFFNMQYLRHTEFLKYNAKPKIIIVSVDTFGLSKREDLFLPEQFLPYLLFNKNIEENSAGYKEFGKLDYHLPLARYFGKTRSLTQSFENIFKSKTTIFKRRYKGYSGLPNEWHEEIDKKNHKRENYRIDLSQPIVDLFERFIRECKTLDIEVILVYSPEYIENQKFLDNRKQIMDVYKQFSDKYNFLFLDYSNDELCYQKENFFDSYHLNYKGADLFTAKLADQLKNYQSRKTKQNLPLK